jgi:hypothetical protein
MRAATPLVIRKLRLDDATRLIEKYGVDMANSLRNAPKSPNPVRARSSRKSGPKCDDNQFLDKNRDGIKRHQGTCISDFSIRKRRSASPRSLRNPIRCFGQAAACAFRFLRQPSKPNAPRPVAKSESAPGSGVATAKPSRLTSENASMEKL